MKKIILTIVLLFTSVVFADELRKIHIVYDYEDTLAYIFYNNDENYYEDIIKKIETYFAENKSTFEADGSFNMDFKWDQELQDAWDNNK